MLWNVKLLGLLHGQCVLAFQLPVLGGLKAFGLLASWWACNFEVWDELLACFRAYEILLICCVAFSLGSFGQFFWRFFSTAGLMLRCFSKQSSNIQQMRNSQVWCHVLHVGNKYKKISAEFAKVQEILIRFGA